MQDECCTHRKGCRRKGRGKMKMQIQGSRSAAFLLVDSGQSLCTQYVVLRSCSRIAFSLLILGFGEFCLTSLCELNTARGGLLHGRFTLRLFCGRSVRSNWPP